MKIIGLIGKKESGKTTLAAIINKWIRNENTSCYFLQFAGILKTMILKAKICDEEELYHVKTSFSREIMQKIGTNIIREQIDKNFFCKKMIQELKALIKEDPIYENAIVIIDDIRFENEADLIRDVGGILFRIVRPTWGDPDEHRSETEGDKISTSVTIFNDSDLDNLDQAGKNIASFIPAFKNVTSSDLLNADPYDRF